MSKFTDGVNKVFTGTKKALTTDKYGDKELKDLTMASGIFSGVAAIVGIGKNIGPLKYIAAAGAGFTAILGAADIGIRTHNYLHDPANNLGKEETGTEVSVAAVNETFDKLEEAAENVTEEIKEEAIEVAKEVPEKVQDAIDTIETAAEEAKEEIKESAAEAKTKVTKISEEIKEKIEAESKQEEKKAPVKKPRNYRKKDNNNQPKKGNNNKAPSKKQAPKKQPKKTEAK